VTGDPWRNATQSKMITDVTRIFSARVPLIRAVRPIIDAARTAHQDMNTLGY